MIHSPPHPIWLPSSGVLCWAPNPKAPTHPRGAAHPSHTGLGVSASHHGAVRPTDSQPVSPVGSFHTCSSFCHSLHHPALPPIPPPPSAAQPSKQELAEHGWPVCRLISASFFSLKQLPVCSRETATNLGEGTVPIPTVDLPRWTSVVKLGPRSDPCTPPGEESVGAGPMATLSFHINAKQLRKRCWLGACAGAQGSSLLQVLLVTRGFCKPGFPCWSSVSTPTTLTSPLETREGKHHSLLTCQGSVGGCNFCIAAQHCISSSAGAAASACGGC